MAKVELRAAERNRRELELFNVVGISCGNALSNGIICQSEQKLLNEERKAGEAFLTGTFSAVAVLFCQLDRMEPAGDFNMLIKAVLFDVDGTLVDSVDLHAQAWVDAFNEIGYEIPFHQMRAQIGKGGDQLMPVFLSPVELKEKGEALEERRGKIFREGYLPRIQAFPEAAELLKRVDKAGLRTALASSAKEEELSALKRIIGIEDDRLDAETSSSDAERSKPFPDIFEAALAQLPGVSPDETIVIGDTPYDAQAAGKAGIRTIGMLCGGFPEEELLAAGCIAIYRDPAHLLAEYEASPLAAGGMPD